MAKKESRVIVTLVCSECKSQNYTSQKSKKNDPDKLAFNKFCSRCRRQTLHNELKK